MTISTRLAELPPMPKREDTDKWIALFPANDVIKAAAIAGFYEAEASSLRARLSLALEVLDNCPCTCFYEYRESGEDNKNVCDRCAVLDAMKDLR